MSVRRLCDRTGIYTFVDSEYMSSVLRRLYDGMLYKLAFEPPTTTYTRQDLLFVFTKSGNRIAMRCVSDSGELYSKPSSYNTSAGLLVCAHGNGDDIGTFEEYAKTLAAQHSMNVLWFDYCGYGLSSDAMTTEKNMAEALAAVVEYGVNVLRVPISKMVLFGKSIGTVPVIRVAADSRHAGLRGVVLVSPLASGARAFVPAFCATGPMMGVLDTLFADSLHLIQKVEAPVLIVHGYNDQVIDIVNSRLLYARLSSSSSYPPLFVAAGHNDIETQHPVIFQKTVGDFLKHCCKRFDIQAESYEETSRVAEARLIDI